MSLSVASLGTEWVPDDDDAERKVVIHLGQRGRVPGPLHGEYEYE